MSEKLSRIIGLTGSIGSGKSQVADFLSQLGATVIDADILARIAVRPQSEGLQLVVKRFGSQVLTAAGELNRKALANLVFADQAQRLELERIIHPRVRELFVERLNLLEAQTPAPVMIVYSAPILFESTNRYPEIQATLVVTAPRELCIQRVVLRDNCSPEYVARIFDIQLSPADKQHRADYVIHNDGTLEELREKVEHFFRMMPF